MSAKIATGALCLLAAALVVRAQQPQQPQSQQPRPTYSAGVNVVDVLASVRDKEGHIVRDLTKDDFQLKEDGLPQAIKYFSQETNLPLTLGLLIDTSGSQRRVLPEERSASYTFLDQVLHEQTDMAFIIHFDSEIELLQDLSASRSELSHALSLVQPADMRRAMGRGARGDTCGTCLYDAVWLAANDLMSKQHGRKAVIVLTDGVNTGSKESLESAIEAAQRADMLVYSIRFYDSEAYGGGFGGFGMGGRGRRGGRGRMSEGLPDGKKVLQRTSKETGGGYFEVSKKESLAQIYTLINEELRSQYSLGYTSDATNGEGYRKIELTTKRKGLIVQTRDGYYATH